MSRIPPTPFSSLLVLCFLLNTTVFAQDGYKTPPDALAALVDAPVAPVVSISPDGSTMLQLSVQGTPTIAQLAQPEFRLAGLRINPRNNGPSRSRYYVELALSSVDEGGRRVVTGIPEGALISSASWSPTGDHFAFTVTSRNKIVLFLGNPATGTASPLIDRPLNAAMGRAFTWMPDGESMLVKVTSADRGHQPVEPDVPSTPIVQENVGKAAPARTYQDLLATPHDEDLFEWFVQSDLLNVTVAGDITDVGLTGMIASMQPSPDGDYVLTQVRHRPFSYLVPYYRFPNRIEVRESSGELVKMISDLPLMEGVPTGFGSTTTGVRSISWRGDADATLAWVEALDGGNANTEAEYRDELLQLAAPFTGAVETLATLPLRYQGARWSSEGYALVSEGWFATRQQRTYKINTAAPGPDRQVVFEYSSEDRYANPGNPMSHRDENGRYVLVTADDGDTIFLSGTGASPDGDRPFMNKMSLSSGETEELFRSKAPHYEYPTGWIDAARGVYLTRRESNGEPPNYFKRTVGSDEWKAITYFPHPYPEMDGISKELIKYEREDGVPLTADLYLPAGYDSARDGPLPTLVWAYPREFKSAAAAGQVSGSPYRFKSISYWGAIPYVLQGYAVMDRAAMPIVGEGDNEPNDSFVDQLVTSAKAVIDEGVKRGVVDPDRVAIGGHSYGAFMTANLLAHSDLFRAGIARSGAYNRSLTPFGFQREARTFWEAPEIYFAMSPFMHADKVNEPILLIHGMADNNSGTFPIQSERFYSGLKGNGATARLVMLPHESHGYRARESLLHMMWETNNWLDTYVKNAHPRTIEVDKPTG